MGDPPLPQLLKENVDTNSLVADLQRQRLAEQKVMRTEQVTRTGAGSSAGWDH